MNGILFTVTMHKAIREGRKTVTRRLSGLKEINLEPDNWHFVTNAVRDIPPCRIGGVLFECQGSQVIPDGHQVWVNPRYLLGETVYVKEAWATYLPDQNIRPEIVYKLDGLASGFKWRSPLFLPEKYARDFIKIIDVRPERLQEIWIKDAIAEGFSLDFDMQHFGTYKDPKTKFGEKWDSINPKYPWASNPWVWRYEFVLEAK